MSAQGELTATAKVTSVERDEGRAFLRITSEGAQRGEKAVMYFKKHKGRFVREGDTIQGVFLQKTQGLHLRRVID